MYTLRTFKNENEINRLQINLGNSYQVKGAEEEGIKYRIYSENKNTPSDGYAIFEDHHAFIMTANGETFETLNRPKRK